LWVPKKVKFTNAVKRTVANTWKLTKDTTWRSTP
jgi:hypothetical protein